VADLSASATRRRRAGLAAGLVVAIVGLGLARIAISGWAPLAADDARYLFVGLSILDGQGAVTPSGDLYVLRSPAYGLALAVGSWLVGGDPLVGARIVAVAAAILGLLGAVRLGWLAAGQGGAVGTALALASIPLVWLLLPSLRIDLPQTALVVGLLLVAWRPTVRRWAAAGVVFGVLVLVKETALPLLALPVALIGSVPVRQVRRLALAYVGAAVVTAAWWWVVVWMESGAVFPANALAVVEARDAGATLTVPWSALPLLGSLAIGWVVIAWRARQELGARLVLVAGIGLAPAAIYAASLGLNARNFVGLAVLSAVAAGVAGATLVAEARRRLGSSTAPVTRATAAAVLAATLGFGAALPVVGQLAVPRFAPDLLADGLVAWLSANVGEGERVVMTFREREQMALRRFGRTEVRLLGVTPVDAADPPDAFIWMGLRDRQLFGYPRAGWVAALTDPPAAYLVLVSPHPFTPVDLVSARAGGPSLPGLAPVATLDRGGDHADILRIDPARVLAETAEVPLHLAADAAIAWLDLSGGADSAERLLGARPVVSGDGLAELLARLGDRACRFPAPGGASQLGPVGTCPGQ
jgi:hypothetical protein